MIFVVSLPRSGSTLVEQMLASHPQIHGAGELVDLESIIEAESARRAVPFAAWATQATDADWRRLGDAYLEATARWRALKPFVTDKFPGNWRYVGAIRRMLPGARIVVCRRDPLETALSCYRQHFGGNTQAWSYDVASIAAYWHDFERASEHWQALHPASVRVAQYEALVADPRGEIAALLEFCGLQFDPACLEFHKTRREVSTMSASQVREPLRRDTARADRYGALLDPLRSALASVSADRG
jgi:LPS sulfotransferase NodH